MLVIQTKHFGKQKKKLHANQIDALDDAVKIIAAKPTMGEPKKGDLLGVRVYKFKMVNQEYLLAYLDSKNKITLLSIGTHENFYRDLKKIR